MSYKVAVLGNQGFEGSAYWSAHQYGIQVFNLSADQICSLLQDHDPTKGVNIAKLMAVPIAQYQVSGGGRMYPIITREEICKVMQGVDVMLMMLTTQPDMFDFMGQEFYECLIQENLLEQCKAVVVRIAHSKTMDTMFGGHAPKHMTVDAILARYGLSAAKTIKDKLYVLADKEVKYQRSRRWKGKKGKKGKVDADIALAISQLRTHLLGEEVKEVFMAPVKETVSAGKALIGMGQRFSSWVVSLVKS